MLLKNTRFNIVLGLFLVIAGCSQSENWDQQGAFEIDRIGSPCVNDSVSHYLLDMEFTNSKDSVYASSKTKKNKFEFTRDELIDSSRLYDLITTLCIGDSLTMRVRADSFYLGFKDGQLPYKQNPEELITIQLWMIDALDEIKYLVFKQAFETATVKQFLTTNRWNAKRDSATGIYYEDLIYNSAKRVKKSMINYVLKTVSGKIIEMSRDPILFDINDKRMLPGMYYLAQSLSEGESIRAVLPSNMAFGPDGNSKAGVGKFSPILLDLECTEVYR